MTKIITSFKSVVNKFYLYYYLDFLLFKVFWLHFKLFKEVLEPVTAQNYTMKADEQGITLRSGGLLSQHLVMESFSARH